MGVAGHTNVEEETWEMGKEKFDETIQEKKGFYKV